MTNENLKWLAKNVDSWPDGSSEIARKPIEWEPVFNNKYIPRELETFDFVQYATERKAQGLPVPHAPKTHRELEIEEVMQRFKGNYNEERARQVIEDLMEDGVLQLHGWT